MTQPESKMYVLSKSARPDAFTGSLGKLTLTCERDAEEATEFTLLDCHDQSIRASGKLLIETDGALVLLSPEATLSQPATRKGDFVPDLMDGPVRSALSGTISPLRCLIRVGTGTVQQMHVTLVDDEQKTQARAEVLSLTSKGKGKPVSFITLRGLRGYDKAFAAFSTHLEKLGGQSDLSTDPVYERLFPKYERYVAKPDIAMTGDETAFQAANDIIAAYLNVARRNEAGVIGDFDTEFLHDYRVALRKIRSVISLFKEVYGPQQTVDLKTTFSDLMAPTGRLRDLDVYLLDRETYFDLVPEALHGGLEVMFDMFAQERRDALANITSQFRSKTYADTMNGLGDLFSNPENLSRGANADRHAHDYACGLIWKRYRKVCKIASAIDDQTDDEEVHELRIHCKKLRYLMEFFAPLFPGKGVKAVIKPLKKLQDNLGLFNDYSVQQESLQAFLDNHATKGRKQDMAIASSIGALIAVLHQRQLNERARVVTSFADFDSPDVQSRFRSLFHAQGSDK
ncbi:CHAD domain-containing protein [Falsiphaeobacter marinintestinus]|uniref:CHAD domain-containing protein n=1 Tax=Falsiphaeobacter marinintestinus TaxID=1492905 RepID=UPI0011B4F66D|nr:CHAD domain-containing protein [Phaeobacter marinintestinus]